MKHSVSAESEDLRASNAFHLADECGTASKAGPDLGIASSLVSPCQDAPFERAQHLRCRRRGADSAAGTRAQFQDLLDASWASAQSPRDLRRVGSTFHQASHHPFNWAQSYLFGHSFTSDAFRLLSR